MTTRARGVKGIRTTHVRGGQRTLKELGRLLKFVSGTPGTPSGLVKWSASWATCEKVL